MNKQPKTNKMKEKLDIRLLIYCHNEIKMLPQKKKWCDYHGLTMVYFDNESTDGSREWAINNNVFEADIITEGAFNIVNILEVLDQYRKDNKYDWSILNGADMFLSGFNGVRLSDYIQNIDEKGHDGIECNYTMICKGNEPSTLDYSNYTRCIYTEGRMKLIAKQSNAIMVDTVRSSNPYIDKDLWWLNMGNTKSKDERKNTVNRRKKAWKKGMNKGYGNHYKDLENYGYSLPNIVTEPIIDVGAKEALIELADLLNRL